MNQKVDIRHLEKISVLMRYYILSMTTEAGSGHPTSSLSAVELMCGLCFGGVFKYNPSEPSYPNNDRLIFSKGHASPLFYALWAAAGLLTEDELATYRKFGSNLEGHPTVRFPYCEAATGSLGQGLAIGVGMALNAKYIDKVPYRTYVLLGDSEMAEGSQWESIQLAAHYRLDNLVGVLDVNRLGQRGETMYGHDLEAYRQRCDAFGWATVVIDGHSLSEVLSAYGKASEVRDKPTMIIARTIKGKGVSFIEDKNGWHGKTLSPEDYEKAIKELGEVDKMVQGVLSCPEEKTPTGKKPEDVKPLDYKVGDSVATRMAYGKALVRLYPAFPEMVSLDGEVSNSTEAEMLKEAHPDRFFEMYIAEQNMVGAGLGFALRGKIPFVSTFAAFFSRAFDQIRMSQYSAANMKFVGSHAGVSIGEDGPSQMGLEDLAMFRTIHDGVVLYPCDAVSTEKLVEAAADHEGIVYIRTTRMGTPVIYETGDEFTIGGSRTVKKSDKDAVTVVAAGVTLHEALKAYDTLRAEGTSIRVIDLYSIKPVDRQTLLQAARETKGLITVEDHYPEGGLGEAVRSALGGSGAAIRSLAVRQRPMSGKPQELLKYEEIDHDAIVKMVRELV